MKTRELRKLRQAVVRTRCPDCNRFRLEIQDIRGGAASVLCSSCGWFTSDFEPSALS